MAEVTIRELRNHGGDVIDRVAGGEQLTVTRGGKAVAELRPLGGRRLSSVALLKRWSKLPSVDVSRLRHDLDSTIDATA